MIRCVVKLPPAGSTLRVCFDLMRICEVSNRNAADTALDSRDCTNDAPCCSTLRPHAYAGRGRRRQHRTKALIALHEQEGGE